MKNWFFAAICFVGSCFGNVSVAVCLIEHDPAVIHRFMKNNSAYLFPDGNVQFYLFCSREKGGNTVRIDGNKTWIPFETFHTASWYCPLVTFPMLDCWGELFQDKKYLVIVSPQSQILDEVMCDELLNTNLFACLEETVDRLTPQFWGGPTSLVLEKCAQMSVLLDKQLTGGLTTSCNVGYGTFDALMKESRLCNALSVNEYVVGNDGLRTAQRMNIQPKVYLAD